MTRADDRLNLEPFPDWRVVCPEMALLEQNASVIRAELDAIREGEGWMPWVQGHLYDEVGSWTVFNIYGMDKLQVDNAMRVPETCALLARLPSVKTALFSRLGPDSAINPHEGPPRLSNFTLRCHLGLIVPDGCGIGCGGQVRYLRAGEVLMFDDLLEHYGFNESAGERYVLICDIERPAPRPYELPEPIWGENLPEWPRGWEAVGTRGTIVKARTIRDGLVACGLMRS